MKRIIFFICIGLTINVAQSQEVPDALRYSQDNLNGTARFRAMAGAFGALGGDLSSINVNPAGSAIFSNNQLAVTLTNFNKKNDSDYFGTKTDATNNSFNLNQVGGVFVFKNQNQSSNWKKFAVAINYEMTNNFDNSIFSAGRNQTNSVDGYFLSHANFGNGGAPVPQEFVKTNEGESISGLYSYLGSSLPNVQNPNLSGFGAQQAMMGYQAYIINALDDTNNNSKYVSNVTPGGNYYQENRVYSNGYNGKLSFNASTSYKDKLYIGVNLNSHFLDFTQSSSFYESNNNNPVNANYTVKNLRFNNNLYTYGTGFSFQIGAIAKVTNEIRLGFTYDSPIWYNLNDEFSQNLTAVRTNNVGVLPADVVDPKIINYYEPYKLQTPDKWTGSLAYVFGKKGLISFDYSRKDFSTTTFKPKQDFSGANKQISNNLTVSNEFRVGAEYKIKEWSLRGGYRFEESPYKDKRTIGDLNSYSGGLGYNFGMFKLDLAYFNSQRNSAEGFFTQGFTEGAKIKTTNNNFTMTLLFEM